MWARRRWSCRRGKGAGGKAEQAPRASACVYVCARASAHVCASACVCVWGGVMCRERQTHRVDDGRSGLDHLT